MKVLLVFSTPSKGPDLYTPYNWPSPIPITEQVTVHVGGNQLMVNNVEILDEEQQIATCRVLVYVVSTDGSMPSTTYGKLAGWKKMPK